MTTILCTLADYRSLTDENTSTDASARSYIQAASQAVLTYLRRDLTYATRREWFELNGNTLDIFLPEWPVYRIRMAGGVIALGTLKYTGDLADMPSAETQINRLILMSYSAGVQNTTVLKYSTYPTWSQLTAAIALVPGWSIYSSSIWNTYPTRLIRPVGNLASQGMIMEGVLWTSARWKLFDERRIELEGSIGQYCYVEWDSGYLIKDDTDESSSSSSSSEDDDDDNIQWLPDDIIIVTADISRDIFTLGKTSGGLLKSEGLGDYNYSVDPQQVGGIVNRYAPLLSRYRRIGWR